MLYKDIFLKRINHAAVKIKKDQVIFIDPFKIADSEVEKADLILITHEHFDHCSPEDIKKIATAETIVLTIPLCADKLKELNLKEIKYIRPGETIEVRGIKIEAIPAYNINKFRSPGVPFHPPADGKVGFVIEINGVKIYHAGDTDCIPEMKNLKNIDIALLPVSGTYVMTADEAVEAVRAINPQMAIPIHYGAIVGTEDDAKKFKETTSVSVEIL